MQDPNPLPWGAQDRFQAHFIVKREFGDKVLDFTARTRLKTTGKQSVNDATIFVDPTDNGIRIYGKWKNSYDFGITKELFDAYDNIAGHIKKLSTVDT